MRALGLLSVTGLLLIALATVALSSPVYAQTEATVTETIFVPEITETPTNTPTASATIDPCLVEDPSTAGEEVDPCATATVDPCSFENSGEEVDPCFTPSPTEDIAGEPTLTPTLEYEIDEPISFFPTDTVEPENEETVAAIETQEADDSVTELPNTGGGGPESPSYGLAIVLALAALAASGMFAARGRRRA